MAKLLNQRTAMQLLHEHGWTRTVGGKHVVKMVKPGAERPITLPCHGRASYGKGLTHDIVKQAGLSPKEVRGWSSWSKSVTRQRATGRVSGNFQDASRQAEL